MEQAFQSGELFFIAAKVALGVAKVAPNPRDAMEVKYRFMRNLEKLEGKPLLTLAPSARVARTLSRLPP